MKKYIKQQTFSKIIFLNNMKNIIMRVQFHSESIKMKPKELKFLKTSLSYISSQFFGEIS